MNNKKTNKKLNPLIQVNQLLNINI